MNLSSLILLIKELCKKSVLPVADKTDLDSDCMCNVLSISTCRQGGYSTLKTLKKSHYTFDSAKINENFKENEKQLFLLANTLNVAVKMTVSPSFHTRLLKEDIITKTNYYSDLQYGRNGDDFTSETACYWPSDGSTLISMHMLRQRLTWEVP